jgi:hypothetical protein
MEAQADKARARVLRLLAAGEARREACGSKDRLRLVSDRLGAISVAEASLAQLLRDGLVEASGDRLRLTREGRAAHARAREAGGSLLAQHADLEPVTVEVDGARQNALADPGESPLGLLARRKGRDGRPFLDAEQLQAGERLRADYTRGLLMPRLGIDWNAVGGGGRSGRRAGGAAELTDAALSARRRVDDALAAVGPELAGLLVDVCCFLKGLETVETERGWPVRSAKVVLKTALSALARHYAPERRRGDRRIVHWGAADYRPPLRTG